MRAAGAQAAGEAQPGAAARAEPTIAAEAEAEEVVALRAATPEAGAAEVATPAAGAAEARVARHSELAAGEEEPEAASLAAAHPRAARWPRRTLSPVRRNRGIRS
jgi:hypothetical protein